MLNKYHTHRMYSTEPSKMDNIAFSAKEKAHCASLYIKTDRTTAASRNFCTRNIKILRARKTILRRVESLILQGNVENNTGRRKPQHLSGYFP